MKCEACGKRKVFITVLGTLLCKVCMYRLGAIADELEKKGGEKSEGEIQKGSRHEEYRQVQ